MSDAVDCDGLPGERRRIVIADDHEPTRVLLRTLIELEGMQVVGEARDGSEAVALALEHEPDLVLLDINMPRLDGLGAAEIIRARRPSIGLFLHSGEPLDAALERAAALEVPVADKRDLHITIQQLAETPADAERWTAVPTLVQQAAAASSPALFPRGRPSWSRGERASA